MRRWLLTKWQTAGTSGYCTVPPEYLAPRTYGCHQSQMKSLVSNPKRKQISQEAVKEGVSPSYAS
jgi:hypothetical protein